MSLPHRHSKVELEPAVEELEERWDLGGGGSGSGGGWQWWWVAVVVEAEVVAVVV